MQRYEHGGDIGPLGNVRLDFSVNINPLGMPTEVKSAIIENIDGYETYPDPYCRELSAAIEKSEGVARGTVICGNGAADLIFRLCLAVKPRETLLLAPTFSEYEKAAVFAGSAVKFHRLSAKEDFAVGESILDDIGENTQLMFLCNPNNPTGQVASYETVEKIAAKCNDVGAVLVVDECFMDFTDEPSAKPLIEKYGNLVILKAFTKCYAMAGLRLGYAITGNSALIAAMRDAGHTWNVSSVAQSAGLAALGCGEYMARAKAVLKEERAFMVNELSKLGLRVCEGKGDFLMFYCEKDLVEPLLERGIYIRSCDNYEGLGNGFYRIGLKLRNKNEELIAALKEIING